MMIERKNKDRNHQEQHTVHREERFVLNLLIGSFHDLYQFSNKVKYQILKQLYVFFRFK